MKLHKLKIVSLILLLTSVLVLLCWSMQDYYHSPLPNKAAHTRTANADRLARHIFHTSATPDKTYYRNQVIVLMYHDVSPNPVDDKSISVASFRAQLEAMKANHFQWISMEQYVNFVLHGAPVPDNAVLLTFDDGYESFYTSAYPVLQEYGAPATNFVITATIDNPKHIGVAKLSWEQIREMHAKGIDFYNHTNDSHGYGYVNEEHTKQKPLLMAPIHLKALGRMETQAEFEARVLKDLRTANSLLDSQLNNHLHVLAFPYGGHNADTLRLAKSLGIDVTFTVKRGINTPGQTNSYRVNAGGMYTKAEVLIQYMKQGAPMRPLPFSRGYNTTS